MKEEAGQMPRHVGGSFLVVPGSDQLRVRAMRWSVHALPALGAGAGLALGPSPFEAVLARDVGGFLLSTLCWTSGFVGGLFLWLSLARFWHDRVSAREAGAWAEALVCALKRAGGPERLRIAHGLEREALYPHEWQDDRTREENAALMVWARGDGSEEGEAQAARLARRLIPHPVPLPLDIDGVSSIELDALRLEKLELVRDPELRARLEAATCLFLQGEGGDAHARLALAMALRSVVEAALAGHGNDPEFLRGLEAVEAALEEAPSVRAPSPPQEDDPLSRSRETLRLALQDGGR